MALVFQYRRLTPAQEAAISQLAAAGVPTDVLASQYGVSRRTVYRVIHRVAEPVREVVVGAWIATFALRDEGPVQVTSWRATGETASD